MVLFFWLWVRARRALGEVRFSKASLSSKYGKMTEQFMPFLKNFPYNPENFRFIGSPIDGIQFEEDRVILVEFKSSSSTLNNRQKEISEIVRQKKVTFEEIRINN